MITIMQKALDCLERKGDTLKCWRVHLLSYSLKFQCRKIQVKCNKKLKDGTEIALTDKKKSKGSLSCSL